MSQYSKPWSELNFTDNFIFCKVMQDRELCRRMIEILLNLKVEHIEYLTTEKQIDPLYENRGIRLDVYVKDSDRIFDLEMQTGNYDDLLLRARYYQSASDVATTKRRTKFKDIKETYIIFICKDDPFNAGVPVYTKKTVFAETDTVPYDDKSHNVFYNASAWRAVKDEELRGLLRFISEMKSSSSFTKALEESSFAAKSRSEWEDDYMYFIDVLEEQKELAREEGLQEGREAGLQEGLREGALQEKRENAQKALRMGLSPEQVSAIVGLGMEEICAMKNSL